MCRTYVLGVLVVCSLMLFRCAAPATDAEKPVAPYRPEAPGTLTAFPINFSDDAGRPVSIARRPERIISLAPSSTEILFALGLGDRVVAVDQYSDYPAAARQKARVRGYSRPDLEQIVALSPDLVLVNPIHVRTVVPELERLKLTVVVLNPNNLDGVFDRILLVGKITGEEAQARRLVGELQERAKAITLRVVDAPRLRVFFELSPALHTAGPGSFIHDLIERAGGLNIAGDATTQWPQLSPETLFLKDPEVIILAYVGSETPEGVRARPGWHQITAVKTGRIVVIDPDLTSRAGPRVVEGLEAIARALHPDRF